MIKNINNSTQKNDVRTLIERYMSGKKWMWSIMLSFCFGEICDRLCDRSDRKLLEKTVGNSYFWLCFQITMKKQIK